MRHPLRAVLSCALLATALFNSVPSRAESNSFIRLVELPSSGTFTEVQLEGLTNGTYHLTLSADTGIDLVNAFVYLEPDELNAERLALWETNSIDRVLVLDRVAVSGADVPLLLQLYSGDSLPGSTILITSEPASNTETTSTDSSTSSTTGTSSGTGGTSTTSSSETDSRTEAAYRTLSAAKARELLRFEVYTPLTRKSVN